MFADSIANKFRLNLAVSLIRLLLVSVFILFFFWQQITVSLTAGLLVLPWILAAFVQFVVILAFSRSSRRDFVVQSISASHLAIDIATFIPFALGIHIIWGYNVIPYLYFPIIYGILLYNTLFSAVVGWLVSALYLIFFFAGEPLGINIVLSPMLLLYGLAGTVGSFIAEGVKIERSELFKTKQLVLAQEKKFEELKRSQQANQYLLSGAEKRLETVDQVKGEFITLLTHELRTPIAAVRWILESLGQGSEESKTMAEKGIQSIDRVNFIIDRINQAGTESSYVFAKEPLDVLVKEIVGGFAAEALRKNITLVESYPDVLSLVMMDRKRLQVAIEEVLNNAVTFTPSGGMVHISIDDREANTARGALIVRVADSGIGITPAEKDKVFEKFYRGEGAIKVDTDGTGLGLYMAREIIDKHGGMIWFEDNPSGGTIFSIRIPINQ